MLKRNFLKVSAVSCLALMTFSSAVFAQEVTLRLHQFLPPVSNIPKNVLKPWGEAVEKASNGRIKIEHFDAMALGGPPPGLMDQARDGVVDIVMTLPGYTPGRFPKSEVFELPFMMKGSIATSKAFWELTESQLQNEEFKDFKILGAWVHGPGVIHTAEPVATLEDMTGKKLRGPTRVITDLLGELGATAVGMPLPSVPEALSKGVINGTVIPWEVTTSLKLAELVGNHTEFSGNEALYTATFVLAMNKAKYESLPDDLRAILDAESGMKLTELAANVMLDGDEPSRQVAADNGNNIITLDKTETARWKTASRPVVDRWIASMAEKNIDGAALIAEAQALIDKYQE